MQTVLTPASLGEKWTGPIAIHYGSNAGTAESFARRLKSQLAGKGVDASTGILNAAVEKLDPQTLHVLICASYEGRPPHNAKRFFKWMEGLPEEALAGVPFAVFGCGNRDWHRTYQAVPKTLSEQLRRAGAREILARGEGDASQNIFQDFELWSHDVLNLIPSAVEGGGQTVPRSTERTLSSH